MCAVHCWVHGVCVCGMCVCDRVMQFAVMRTALYTQTKQKASASFTINQPFLSIFMAFLDFSRNMVPSLLERSENKK